MAGSKAAQVKHSRRDMVGSKEAQKQPSSRWKMLLSVPVVFVVLVVAVLPTLYQQDIVRPSGGIHGPLINKDEGTQNTVGVTISYDSGAMVKSNFNEKKGQQTLTDAKIGVDRPQGIHNAFNNEEEGKQDGSGSTIRSDSGINNAFNNKRKGEQTFKGTTIEAATDSECSGSSSGTVNPEQYNLGNPILRAIGYLLRRN